MSNDPNQRLRIKGALDAINHYLDGIPETLKAISRKRSLRASERAAWAADVQTRREGLKVAKAELTRLNASDEIGDGPAWAVIVRRWRVNNGVTLPEMAEAIGFLPSDLSAMERGAFPINDKTAEAIADMVVGPVGGPAPQTAKTRKAKGKRK